jgi:outer membrane protein assembly factor BamB
LAIGIVLLFLGLSLVTMLVPAEQQEPRTRSPYDCYHLSDTIPSPLPMNVEDKTYSTPVVREASRMSDYGLQNSPWPMYCHDAHHTGRSSYSTAKNPPGLMKWNFKNNKIGALYGSPVIDNNGIIYFGGLDFFALYPNGTLKWQYPINGWSESCPAIDENGIIYLGTAYGDPNYFYAIYPNGTMKWRYWIGGGTNIESSPAIGTDGTIYFGCGQSIVALYPTGTLRWQHSTNHVVYSSPAIGDDGTVYCGCHDKYLYALYPNNGTEKWKFQTGDWIRVSPCIADDGTLYCVSLDGYLYAIRPNGTMKWRTNVGAGTSPTIGPDGTIYAGWSELYAINPDGSVKWVFDSAGGIEGGTPCTSKEGIIYFGSSSGYCIAVNPDGTEAWRAPIGQCQSAPAIGEDGTIYIGGMDGTGNGYLYAFGEPEKIEIQKPIPGRLYFFGIGLSRTLLENTVIIGSVNVKVRVYSEDQLESLHFYVDGSDQHNVTTSPFEWRMNQRYGNIFPMKHTVTVTGYYKGGSSWSESIDVLYFHL